MHQSPLKQLGAPRREKYALFDLSDGERDRRAQKSSPPKARRFQVREESPREERGARQHPRF